MTRVTRWAVPALMLAVPLGLLLPALAQPAGDRPSSPVNEAKQIVAMIEQGQLDMATATEMAEKHVDGTAIRARCEVQSGAPRVGKPEPAPGGAEEPPASGRLIYSIMCFAKDKLHVVRVDAQAKKVLEPEPKPEPMEKTPSPPERQPS